MIPRDDMESGGGSEPDRGQLSLATSVGWLAAATILLIAMAALLRGYL